MARCSRLEGPSTSPPWPQRAGFSFRVGTLPNIQQCDLFSKRPRRAVNRCAASPDLSNLIECETETSEEPGSQLLDCRSSDQARRRANHVRHSQAPRTSAWLRENLIIGETATVDRQTKAEPMTLHSTLLRPRYEEKAYEPGCFRGSTPALAAMMSIPPCCATAAAIIAATSASPPASPRIAMMRS